MTGVTPVVSMFGGTKSYHKLFSHTHFALKTEDTSIVSKFDIKFVFTDTFKNTKWLSEKGF